MTTAWYELLAFYPMIIGFFFCLLALFTGILVVSAETEAQENTIGSIMIGLFLFGCTFVGMSAYANHCESTSGITVTRLGVGPVISLENSSSKHSITTHTVVRLNGVNYTCYGYVPDAKKVTVVETRRNLSQRCTYKCELPLEEEMK